MVIDVRDGFTGATYPVEADFEIVQGLVLEPAEDHRMNPFAHLAEVYLPHFPRCNGSEVVPDCNCEPGDGCSFCGGIPAEDPGEPAGVASDPIADDPDPALDIESTELSEGPH